MKRLIFLSLACIGLQAYSQNHLVGVKIGPSITNVNRTGNLDFKYKPGISAGITYDYLFGKYFSAGADVMFEQNGYRSKIALVDNTGGLIGDTKADFTSNYLAIPLKFGVHFGETFYGFANIGVDPAFRLSSVTKTYPVELLGGLVTIPESKTKVTNLRPFDMGGFIQAGGGYKIQDTYWLYASLTYRHSFMSYYKSSDTTPILGQQNRFINHGFGVHVGVKINLTNLL